LVDVGTGQDYRPFAGSQVHALEGRDAVHLASECIQHGSVFVAKLKPLAD
jgi:hypothetical protein